MRRAEAARTRGDRAKARNGGGADVDLGTPLTGTSSGSPVQQKYVPSFDNLCKAVDFIHKGKKRVGHIEGVNSAPRGPALDDNLLVHAGTNSGPFCGSNTVSNLERTNSSAMNVDDILVKELKDRPILIEGIRDLSIESSGLGVEQGYEAHGGFHLNETEGDQHIDIAIPNEAVEAERDLEFVGEQMPGNEGQSNVLHEEAERTPMAMEEDAGNVVVPGDDNMCN